jgi:hypothetical protein
MIASLLLAVALTAPVAPQGFDELFTGRTLRFDYHHAGTATEEHVALDELRLEGPWAGSRTQLVDRTNLGKYLFEVVDPTTNQVIWSRGFCSLYGEWETTGEARRAWRSIHESQRFPEPRGRVQLVLKKRQPDGSFREVFARLVDPTSRFVDRSPIPARGEVVPLIDSGPPATKVDLLVVSDGYTREQREEFLADVRRLTGVLFETEPFARRRGDFNVRALFVPSPQSGIPNPRQGSWPATALDLRFNSFDSDRYVLTFANETLRETAAVAPYDHLMLLFNSRKYGGGGIFNLWATCASDTEPAAYIFVHEFGHSFAGLADEYYTSQVAYEDWVPAGSEPWEPNVTALLDPARLKWRDLVEPGTPLPTPWNQQAYDEASHAYQARRAEMIAAGASEEAMDALFAEVKAITGPMLQGERHFGQVGAFEGAAYQAKGLYRPEADCLMFTRNPTSFCRVCERAIERVIDLYAR